MSTAESVPVPEHSDMGNSKLSVVKPTGIATYNAEPALLSPTSHEEAEKQDVPANTDEGAEPIQGNGQTAARVSFETGKNQDNYATLARPPPKLSALGSAPAQPKGRSFLLRKAGTFTGSVRSKFFDKYGLTTRTLGRVKRFMIPRDDIEISKKVGEGACGEVFLGKVSGENAAIKTVRSTMEADSQEMKDMISELKVTSDGLNHPNIVQFKGVCVDGGMMLLAFEFMSGGNLEEFLGKPQGMFSWLSKKPLSQAVKWSVDLLGAIEFLHSKDPPIVHRDLKPANLMLTGDFKVLKLADFGLSRSCAAGENVLALAPQASFRAAPPAAAPGAKGRKASMTTFAGTPRYMAPEMAQGKGEYSEKVDVYACGLIMWSMVARTRPWPNLSGDAAMVQALAGSRPPMTKKSFPPELMSIIAGAWEHDVGQRKSAGHLLALANTQLMDRLASSAGCFGASRVSNPDDDSGGSFGGSLGRRRKGPKGLTSSKSL